tara:strand:+ start:351 stop:788 length:438 start_codon:yes stop_codon:yes gene_type:complete
MENTLENIIEPLLEAGQVLMEVTEDNRGRYIRVVIDSENELTLTDTTHLTKTLKETEILTERFPEGFRLEVSTPGIGSPLVQPFQYKKNLNRNLNVTYLENGSEVKTTSKIVSANNDSFELENDNETFFLSYDQVKSAKVKVSFK